MVDDELTLHAAANLLGVHYMTAYRYVRLGLLPAAKMGGTWRVSRADVDKFSAGGPLSPRIEGGSSRRAPWAKRLEARLLAGDARGAWGVIEAALTSGAELDEIYLSVIAPAMAAIGERWERGQLDVSLEHRATAIAMRLVGRLGPRFVRPGRTRGVVIIGAPAGEDHALPVAILADLLRQHGWDVSDLGANVPDSSFVYVALTTPDVVAVGISVTSDDFLESARSALRALRESTSVALVIGGRAIAPTAAAAEFGADLAAHDVSEFIGLLDTLSPGHHHRRVSPDG